MEGVIHLLEPQKDHGNTINEVSWTLWLQTQVSGRRRGWASDKVHKRSVCEHIQDTLQSSSNYWVGMNTENKVLTTVKLRVCIVNRIICNLLSKKASFCYYWLYQDNRYTLTVMDNWDVQFLYEGLSISSLIGNIWSFVLSVFYFSIAWYT